MLAMCLVLLAPPRQSCPHVLRPPHGRLDVNPEGNHQRKCRGGRERNPGDGLASKAVRRDCRHHEAERREDAVVRTPVVRHRDPGAEGNDRLNARAPDIGPPENGSHRVDDSFGIRVATSTSDNQQQRCEKGGGQRVGQPPHEHEDEVRADRPGQAGNQRLTKQTIADRQLRQRAQRVLEKAAVVEEVTNGPVAGKPLLRHGHVHEIVIGCAAHEDDVPHEGGHRHRRGTGIDPTPHACSSTTGALMRGAMDSTELTRYDGRPLVFSEIRQT